MISRLARISIASVITITAFTSYPSLAQPTAKPDTPQPSGKLPGIVADEVATVYKGWSVRRFLNQNVYNELGDQVGTVTDIVVSPDRVVTYIVVGTGGLLGYDAHDVALPIRLFKLVEGQLVLPYMSATALASMPEFRYADLDFQPASARRD